MIQARNVTGHAARGAAVAAAALLAVGLPLSAHGQALRGPLNARAASPPAAPPAQPPAPPRPLAEAVAAVVNDDIISTYDLAQRMSLLITTSGAQPDEQTLPQFQREALLSLVDEHLQMQELRRVQKEQKMNDLIATDDEVDEELKGMAQQNNLTTDQFLGELAAHGIGPDTMRQQIRAQMSWQRWIRGRYGSRLRIGEDQIKATQQRLAAAAAKPQYQLSEVLIDANRVGGMDAAMKGASQLLVQMQQGAPFPAVARQFSSSPTAANGGDAGWVTQGEMAPEVDAALEQLRPGQMSQPIPVREGVYIIYLRDKRTGAGGTMVKLKQAAIALPSGASAADEAAARAKLETVRSTITNCDSLEAAAAKTPGVVAGDLGEAAISDLAPQFKEVAETLEVGQVSHPVRTAAGLHLVAVCGKHAAGGAQLEHDDIESRLYGQQLSMISRRYMRDLRNSATIETR